VMGIKISGLTRMDYDVSLCDRASGGSALLPFNIIFEILVDPHRPLPTSVAAR